VVETTVQRNGANYFGRYIEQQIRNIPSDEISESHDHRWPTVLIIGPHQYTRQVREHLESKGFQCNVRESNQPELTKDDAYAFLKENLNDNLGWRILIEIDRPGWSEDVLRTAIYDNVPLVELVPADYRAEISAIVEDWQESPTPHTEEPTLDLTKPTIQITSFEGSKGLSSSHVFIVGIGLLPENSAEMR